MKNLTPQDEDRASWLIPLKMVNIVKASLIFWHDNITLSKTTMGPTHLWIQRTAADAVKDIRTFIANLVASKGEVVYEKYHIKN